MALLTALALASTPLAAAAQTFIPLRVGQAAEGRLAEGDPRLSERGRFKVYRFDAVAGRRYIISMTSEDFDPFVAVARTVGGITDVMKSDDDGGEGTNSRMRWTARQTGAHLIIAQAFSEEGTGGYSVKVETAPEPTTAAVVPLQLGRSVSGALAESDASLDEDDSFYDSYTLRAQQGQRLVLEMRSDSFDTFVHLGRMQGGEFESLAQDDDGLEGTNSRLRYTVPEAGEYVIRANSVGAGETGPYTLVVRERPAPAAAREQAIRVGASVNGELTESDAELEDEEIYYDLYALQGSRGQRVQVDMQAEYDTYLDLGQMRDGSWNSIRTDDDGGEGTNARLRVTLPEDGTFLIRARSFGDGVTGAYTLAVRDLPPAPVARPQAVRLGEPVRGSLAESDAVLDDEQIYYDLYTLRGRQGQRLVVEMRSDSFDTYLDLGRMQDGAWESLRTDDDGMGEGTHSRLRYTLPSDGEYMIRARSLGENGTGPYTFTVTERTGGAPTPARQISGGQELQGTLEDTDRELDDGSFYDVYTYSGQRGEELTIDMRSSAFDTYVSFGRMVGGSFEEIATNDDGEEGTDSHLVVRLTEPGEYTIRANSLGGGRTGAYTIRVATSRDR